MWKGENRILEINWWKSKHVILFRLNELEWKGKEEEEEQKYRRWDCFKLNWTEFDSSTRFHSLSYLLALRNQFNPFMSIDCEYFLFLKFVRVSERSSNCKIYEFEARRTSLYPHSCQYLCRTSDTFIQFVQLQATIFMEKHLKTTFSLLRSDLQLSELRLREAKKLSMKVLSICRQWQAGEWIEQRKNTNVRLLHVFSAAKL